MDHPYLSGACIGLASGIVFAGTTLALGGSFTCGGGCGQASKVAIDGVKGAKNLFRPTGNTRIAQIRGVDGKPIARLDYGKISNAGKKVLHIDTKAARHIPVKTVAKGAIKRMIRR